MCLAAGRLQIAKISDAEELSYGVTYALSQCDDGGVDYGPADCRIAKYCTVVYDLTT